MNTKFKNVPNDEDTTIEFSRILDIEGVEVLYQKWRWEGVVAESLIFSAEIAARLSREEILQLASKSGLIEDINKTTYQAPNNGFVFVNFNFIS